MSHLSMKKTGLILLAVCVCAVIFWMLMKKHAPAPELAYDIQRQVRYSFTLQNKANSLLKEARFWTYAPVKQTPTQRCVNIEASYPFELIVDRLGNQILSFSFKDLPPYGSKIVTIKADLELADTSNKMPEDDLQPFLGSEKFIESDHPEIADFAVTFKGSETVKVSEKIYQWVASNVEYTGYSGKDRGALYAFKKKKGDCTEFMYLFAALCRASEIPSRCIGGYICSKNAILKPRGYHNWAEIYESGTWKHVDPQNKVFMQNPSHYVAMRIIGDAEGNPMGEHHRFRYEGEGLKVKMNS